MDHRFARPGVPIAVAIATVLFVLVPDGAMAGKLQVRLYDADRYYEHGEIQFVVDARRDGVPVENLARENWILEAAGYPVEAAATASSFRSAGMPTSVLIIVPATPNFTGMEEVGAEEPRERPVRFVLEAVSSLKTALGQADLVTIHCYDEVRPEPSDLGTNRKVSRLRIPTPEEVDAKCRSDAGDSGGGQPRLQTLLLSSIQKWLSKRPTSGREVNRFVVVVITDGDSKEVIQENWFRSIQRSFSDPTQGWIELYVVGLEDGGDPANLQALAKSGVLATAQVRQDIPNEMTRLAHLISGAGLYSVNYVIEDSVEGSTVEMTIGVGGSTDGFAGSYALAGLERKTSWLQVVLLIVGIVVGLLLLILLVRLIGAALAARRQRKAEADEAMAQPYEGPTRGRLIVRDGPATGESFHLVADTTYIGRSPENEIALPDPSVGKRHASIRIKDRSYLLEDLQSVNGVFVNGQRVLKANLKDGDSIRLGGTEMQFSL